MNRNNQLPRIHKHTLIEMNMAVFTARRDAAYDRMVAILHHEILPADRPRRRVLYARCVSLIDEAIAATQRSQTQQDTPLLRYLHLLRDTLGASLANVQHEITLTREAHELSRLVGTDLSMPLPSQDSDRFSNSEMNILDCLDSLLKFGTPLISAESRDRIHAFGEQDLRRYHLARNEYDTFYQRVEAPSSL